MTDWTIVLWNDARQIAQHAGLAKTVWPATGMSPQAFFEKLRQDGQLGTSAQFIASSLPRFEAISWVAKAMPQPNKKLEDYRPRRQLFDLAQRWIGDPDDENRRAVFDVAETANTEWPETLLGLSVFFSGGSIAPPDLEPVIPEPHIAALFAASALNVAAMENPEEYDSVMHKALDLAHQVAINGRESLLAR